MGSPYPDVMAVKRLRRLRREAEPWPSIVAAIRVVLVEAEAVMHAQTGLRAKALSKRKYEAWKAKQARRAPFANRECEAILDAWRASRKRDGLRVGG